MSDEAERAWWRWAMWAAAFAAVAYFAHGQGYESGRAAAIREAPEMLAVREHICEAQEAYYTELASEPTVCETIFELVREELYMQDLSAQEGEAEANARDYEPW